MLFAYLLYSRKLLSKRILFGIGLVLGLIFFLINDQGTYLILSFIPLYFLNDVIKYKKNIFASIEYYKITFNNFLFIFLGFLIGSLPLIIYLIQNKAVGAYLHYFSDLNNLIVVLKTPFFGFITSRDNLFTIIILGVTLFYLSIKYIYFRNKLNLISYYELSLSLSILCLEQKSIVRSISSQITFVSFILLILLLYELLAKTKYFHAYRKLLVFSAVLFFVVFLLGLKENNLVITNIFEIASNIKMSISGNCYKNNLNNFLLKNPDYVSIVNRIKKQPDFNGKIFSFPSGDLVIYILFNQIPPFYNSLASDSSLSAQNNTVQYIKDNHIKYATLYYANPDSILDGVPSYIRQATELKYLLTNFYPLDVVTDHLILVKRDNSDFLKSPLLDKVQQYKESLLNVSLGMIPYSEGLYKYKSISMNKPLIRTNSWIKLNEYLDSQKFSSKNKILVLTPSGNLSKGTQNWLEITTDDGMKTTVDYDSCGQNMPCILNLANIPLFYKDRNIKNIQFDKKFNGEIKIIEIKNLGNLW